MDIFRLKDDISIDNKNNGRNKDVFCGNELKITDIRQAMRDENRVNVFVNNRYSFSLDISQVVDLGVKKGSLITPEKLEEYKKASEFGKEYQRALEWALLRPRATKELRDYLKRRRKMAEAKVRQKEWKEEKEGKPKREREIKRYDFDDLIIERLSERGHVSDEKFARYYVENRFVKKGVSSKRLRMELMKKGVSRDVIEQVMNDSGRSDEEEIRKIIAKKRAKYDEQKLIQYLCRQGFSYDLVKDLVEETTR